MQRRKRVSGSGARRLVRLERNIDLERDGRGIEDIDVNVHAVMILMVEIGLLKVRVVRFRMRILTRQFSVHMCPADLYREKRYKYGGQNRCGDATHSRTIHQDFGSAIGMYNYVCGVI